MTNPFSIFKKSHRTPLEGKERGTLIFFGLLFAGLFLFSSVFLWLFLYSLCNMIGAIVSGSPDCAVTELLRLMPRSLLAWASAGLAVAALSLGRTDRVSIRANRIRRTGFLSIVLGCITALWIVVGLCVGEYESLIGSYSFTLFPLDVLLESLMMIGFGMHSFVYAKRLNDDKIPQKAKKEKTAETEKNLPVFHSDSLLFRIGRAIEYVLAACGFSAFCLGIFTMDWRHGGIFFNVMLLLCYVAPVSMLAVYRYVTTELKEDERPKATKQFSLLFLICNAILLVLYLVAVQLQNEAPNLNAFSILPIEFTASFNAFLFLYPIGNLVPPLAGFLKSIKKKENR